MSINHVAGKLRLAAAREEWLAGDKQGTPPLQRIVLYVDDLDRCTPERVVDVLQAVNLLLTMDLFMVVVAVDPRWLLKALSWHHRELLHDSGDGHQVSPLDYLDKIFHIPFALRPMGARAGDYLRSMLPVGNEPGPELAQLSVPIGVTAEGDTITIPQNRSEESRSASTPDQEVQATQVQAAQPPAPQPASDLNPEGLRVRRLEQDFLAKLAPLLPTPRAVKKLANLYRLVRLSILPGQLDAFLGDEEGGPYQAAALLLAALVGAPRDARDLLVTLQAVSPGEDITQALDNSGPHDRLSKLIKELRSSGMKVHTDAATYQAWATTVARYGFETYDLFTESV